MLNVSPTPDEISSYSHRASSMMCYLNGTTFNTTNNEFDRKGELDRTRLTLFVCNM